MVATDPVAMIFQDAREVHASALQKLAEGDIRDAAEKAWCATKRATDALILARTGEEPPTTSMTYRGPSGWLGQGIGRSLRSLVGRYFTAASATSCMATCFYNGMCGPDETERRIRQTSDYIEDAENLAYR